MARSFFTKLLIVSALLMAGLSGSASAQIIIKGIVNKENGKGAKGCEVYVKGNPKNRTKVAKSGFWALQDVKPEDVLVFSMPGYVEVTSEVGDFLEIDVNLIPLGVDREILSVTDEDGVEVGYGVLRRKEVSSSVASFKVKDINMEAYMEVRTMVQEMCDDFLGYYIPKSDLTFKAYWKSDIQPINIWHALNSTARESGDLENTINNVASNLENEVNISYQSNTESMLKNLTYTISTNNGPEIFLLRTIDNVENVEDLEYEPVDPFEYFKSFSDFFMPVSDTQNHDFVINNFDELIYQYVYNSSTNEVFGFPLYSYQTLLRSKSGVLEIPATARVYGFLNKYKFENSSNEKMHTISEKFLKELSQNYLEK
mgnify:CR=1 FL=1